MVPRRSCVGRLFSLTGFAVIQIKSWHEAIPVAVSDAGNAESGRFHASGLDFDANGGTGENPADNRNGA